MTRTIFDFSRAWLFPLFLFFFSCSSLWVWSTPSPLIALAGLPLHTRGSTARTPSASGRLLCHRDRPSTVSYRHLSRSCCPYLLPTPPSSDRATSPIGKQRDALSGGGRRCAVQVTRQKVKGTVAVAGSLTEKSGVCAVCVRGE